MLKQGDCYDLMKGLDSESVDLVYLDPPFFTQRTHTLRTRDNQAKYVFEDKWDSREDYLNFIRQRLEAAKRTLKPTGSIFLHCDKSASHNLRLLLDEVFGEDNFQSEIIWSYKRWSNAKKGLLNSHQNIYFYSKTEDFKFNRLYDDYSATTNIDQIFQNRKRDENGKTHYKTNDEGQYEIAEAKKGVPLSDIWDIPYLNPKARERVGYPTQKPILLLERIINLVTHEGDTVLDPFCGSGTTCVAAQLLDRQHIGFDISSEAIELSKHRLADPIKSESMLLKNGRNSYRNLSEEIRAILELLDIQPVERNGGIDGFARFRNEIKPLPVKIHTPKETLAQAELKMIKAAKKNKFKKLILISTGEQKSETKDLGEVLIGLCGPNGYHSMLETMV